MAGQQAYGRNGPEPATAATSRRMALTLLPAEAMAAAGEQVGRVTSLEPLGGLSGRTVAAVHGTDGSVVVKGPAPAAEVEAVRRLPGLLARQGVRTARMLALADTADGPWIVMEYLPRALPPQRWGADRQVIAALRALHALPTHAVVELPDRYRPTWDAALTASAAAALGIGSELADRLGQLARRAEPLFDPRCVVSGDPNPLNWRLDDDGHPVLLDLERITLATPALDLAIVLPGLPDREAATAVVAVYGEGAPAVDDILLAKAWTVVELAATAPPRSSAHDAVARIRPAFLSWLDLL